MAREVDRELARRVEALRRPLELAAADNFRGVRKVQGLGHALRAACDGLVQKLEPEGRAAALVSWRTTLATWEQLGEHQHAVEVARGLRLIASHPAQREDKPPPKQKAPLPESDPLAAPTHSLPGIGPAFAERLAEKGLETVEDLLWCLPRRYDDVRDAKPLAEVARMEEGMRATFAATVASARMVFARGRRWAEVRIGGVDLTQTNLLGTNQVSAVVRWFNVWAGIEKRMPAGSLVTLSGVVKKRSGRVEFANPDILAIDVPEVAEGSGDKAKPKKAPPTILARYPEVAGVPASRLRTACQTAC